jgi:NADH-quinone oxidoreductase subunit L
MVASANLLMLFIFWQLLSWLLGLLAYHYTHLPTVRGAFKTFTMLRAGDVAFLAGIVLAYHLYGTLDFQQLFSRAANSPVVLTLGPGGGFAVNAATAITVLIFIGAMSKSAQIPMHLWLPDSLYAPTPVHALLHAGIINAGGFLLNRLAPLYGLSPAALHFVFVIGGITTILGASMMLTQNSVKKTLGYSTIGQMGFMIMECGLGAFALAIFHLIAHGLFKATVFLNCGDIIHAARQEPRHPPPQDQKENVEGNAGKQAGFSHLTWGAGFLMTLILPLIILLSVHGALRIPLLESQGTVIFLFFSWVTSSQAVLTLYRLQAVSSWKVASIMLLALLSVVFTYLLAAEHFTRFLYPAAGEAASYFMAAALPGWLFDLLVAATALSVILGWVFIYAKSHGRTIRTPEWVDALQVRLYILFMNRLYLDSLYLGFGERFIRFARRLDHNRSFRYALVPVIFVILLSFFPATSLRTEDLSNANALLFLIAGLMLPLFPMHVLYVTALTRLPGYLPVLASVLLPSAGLLTIRIVLPEMPAEVLGAVGILALTGAIYGSFKALVQFQVERLVAYAGLTFFSILWWYLARTGDYAPQAAVFAGAVVLIIGGMLLAWRAVQTRFGNLDLNRIYGLARPMPRFSVLLSLMIMAAVGLPPFGLFSGFIEMLLNRSISMSWDLAAILLAWLAASWFFLSLMQRLLFGAPRTDILYTDLRGGEVASLVIVLLLLLAIGLVPYGFLESGMLPGTESAALEFSLWSR